MCASNGQNLVCMDDCFSHLKCDIGPSRDAVVEKECWRWSWNALCAARIEPLASYQPINCTTALSRRRCMFENTPNDRQTFPLMTNVYRFDSNEIVFWHVDARIYFIRYLARHMLACVHSDLMLLSRSVCRGDVLSLCLISIFDHIMRSHTHTAACVFRHAVDANYNSLWYVCPIAD